MVKQLAKLADIYSNEFLKKLNLFKIQFQTCILHY
jgi:hypothetical protein